MVIMITIRLANKKDIVFLQKLNKEVFEDNIKYDAALDLGWSMSQQGEVYYSFVINNEQGVCLVA
jgi:hypothetical protein